MIKAAAARGWLNEEQAVMETMLSFRRAGADLIATYFCKDIIRNAAICEIGQPDQAPGRYRPGGDYPAQRNFPVHQADCFFCGGIRQKLRRAGNLNPAS